MAKLVCHSEYLNVLGLFSSFRGPQMDDFRKLLPFWPARYVFQGDEIREIKLFFATHDRRLAMSTCSDVRSFPDLAFT